MKNLTVIGIAIGLAIALATAIDGFSGFLWALIFGAIGGVIGAHYEGRVDLKTVWDQLTSSRGGRG